MGRKSGECGVLGDDGRNISRKKEELTIKYCWGQGSWGLNVSMGQESGKKKIEIFL